LLNHKNMLELAFKNKHLVIVLALLVAVLSAVALQRLPVDILPNYKTSAVQVLTLYPGMPAEVMEKDVTSRLERWTGQANGIARQESKSLIGVSIVKDFFRDDTDPNAALSQVTSLAMSDLYYLPPGTVPPMVMPYDPTAATPLALLAVSSDSLSEKELYDIAYFQLRNLLGSVPGIIAPAVYGGKLRRIYMYVYPEKLQAYHLSQTDVVAAVQKNNVMIPTGDVNIGNLNYSVNANGMLPKIDDFNHIVVKMEPGGAPVFLQDIGYAKDASAIQTNVVHINGKRQVYIPIYKRTGANTIASVEAVKGKLAELKQRLPKAVNLDVILDQSTYVRQAISGLVQEGGIGLALVSLALLLFLGNLRATFIVALSIPLSILFAFIGLYFTGDTINSMTLGGLALAIGLLVDDSIVVLENIDKHLQMGKTAPQAAYDGTKEVAMPVLVTTLTIIIVFFPVVFLTGIAKFLFAPLAITVSLAMIGSRFISMTLVPILAAALFKGHGGHAPTTGFLAAFDRGVRRLTDGYVRSIGPVLRYRWWVLGGVAGLFGLALVGFTRLGTELFPHTDVGQLSLDVRLESGTRLEKTEQTITEIEAFLQHEIGPDLNIIISNMGVLNDWPAAYTPNSGTQDATLAVQLKEDHRVSTAAYVTRLRPLLKQRFPGVEFIFNTGGIVTSALNFGLPSPLDIQVTGNDLAQSHAVAEQVRALVRDVHGTEDVRIQQRYDHPEIKVDIDRTKAAAQGISADDVVKNTVAALNSSVNFKPSFWIDEKNGNHYYVGVTYPEVALDNPQAVRDITLTGPNGQQAQLKDISKTSLTTAPIEINHLDIQRVTDVFANVEGRDIGAVASEVEQRLAPLRQRLPEGYKITIRGEVQSMHESFANLGLGLGLAVLLVYLVIVPLLRSFTLPLIIIAVIPLGLIGVVALLLATDTYLNIQSMMGIIMMVGISVAYSNLLVEKMNTLLHAGHALPEAIREGVANRFRPILMTAVVAVFALLPMALGFERGSEATVPLARAIIGGVLAATLLSLFVVPILFFMFAPKAPAEDVASEQPVFHKAVAASLLLLLALGTSACGSAAESGRPATARADTPAAPRNVPTVLVAHPARHDFEAPLAITGTARAYQVGKVYARTSGYLRQVRADIGSFVHSGQVLAVLDNPDLLSQRARLVAELKGKQSIYERLKSIYTKTPQLTTVVDVEKAEADYASLRAQLTAMQAQIGFLQVKAPFAGVVTNRYVDEGAVVQSGLASASATPLFEVQALRPIRLVVEVPEADAVLIHPGTLATVTFPELPATRYARPVARVAYGLSGGSNTMHAEIDLPNADLKVRPGMYATVALARTGHRQALAVPNEALGNAKGQSFVYVVAKGICHQVNVTTGLQGAHYTELLTGQVPASAAVVVEGKQFCSEGAAVRATEAGPQPTK